MSDDREIADMTLTELDQMAEAERAVAKLVAPKHRKGAGRPRELGNLGRSDHRDIGPRVPGLKIRRVVDVDRLRELAELGLSLRQAAAALGMSVETLRTRLAEQQTLRGVWDGGQANLIEVCARVLREAVENGNVQVAAFILKSKGYVDREPTTEVRVNIGSQPASASPAHAEELLREQALLDGPLPPPPRPVRFIDGELVRDGDADGGGPEG